MLARFYYKFLFWPLDTIEDTPNLLKIVSFRCDRFINISLNQDRAEERWVSSNRYFDCKPFVTGEAADCFHSVRFVLVCVPFIRYVLMCVAYMRGEEWREQLRGFGY
jgi:hypothetical protein